MNLNLRMLNDAAVEISESELDSSTGHLVSRLFIWSAAVESFDPQDDHIANVVNVMFVCSARKYFLGKGGLRCFFSANPVMSDCSNAIYFI